MLPTDTARSLYFWALLDHQRRQSQDAGIQKPPAQARVSFSLIAAAFFFSSRMRSSFVIFTDRASSRRHRSPSSETSCSGRSSTTFRSELELGAPCCLFTSRCCGHSSTTTFRFVLEVAGGGVGGVLVGGGPGGGVGRRGGHGEAFT